MSPCSSIQICFSFYLWIGRYRQSGKIQRRLPRWSVSNQHSFNLSDKTPRLNLLAFKPSGFFSPSTPAPGPIEA